jgi:hypothetical protein
MKYRLSQLFSCLSEAETNRNGTLISGIYLSTISKNAVGFCYHPKSFNLSKNYGRRNHYPSNQRSHLQTHER